MTQNAAGPNFSHFLAGLGWQADDALTIHCQTTTGLATTVAKAREALTVVKRGYEFRDAWYSTCPVRPDLVKVRGRRARAREADVVGLRAIWADLDVKPGGMRSFDGAGEVIEALSGYLGVRPTAVVASGHGYHPYWRLESGGMSWEADDEASRAKAKALMRDWGRLVAQEAKRRGGDADNVFDLARILRIPGTVNTKGVRSNG